MSKQISFTKHEQEYIGKFRERMDRAESTEDVKKFFALTMQELLTEILEDDKAVAYEDVTLAPVAEQGYALKAALAKREGFDELWDTSDLPRIIGGFAKNAMNRYRRLQQDRERTESKIHHISSKR